MNFFRDKQPLAPETRPRRYALHYRLQTLEGATFLFWLFIIVLLFFPMLHFSLQGLFEHTVKSVQEQKETEATTIARLLVLEFSHLQDLLTLKPAAPGDIDQELKRLLWEKVTFNEVIQGIELIDARADAQFRHLTFLFYRRTAPELKPMDGPQQLMKHFSGAERELIDLINREQRVDKILQDTINRGPKQEGEMLLRYLPLYVPVPEQGAIYWGVAKIGIDADSLRRLLLLQEEEQSNLWYKLSYRLFLCLIVSGVVVLVFFNIWARRLTEPMHNLSRITDALHSAPGTDVESLLVQLGRLDHGGMGEVISVQQAIARLTRALQGTAGQLADALPQAAIGRLVAPAAAALRAGLARRGDASAPGELAQMAADLEGLLTAPASPWQPVHLTPLLAAAVRLLNLQAPPEIRLLVPEALPPVWGSPAGLAQALLLFLDYSRQQVPGDNALTLRGQVVEDRLEMTLNLPGASLSPDAAERLLKAFADPDRPPADHGLSLAVAIFRQHGGTLTLSTLPGGGRLFQATLPLPVHPGVSDARPSA